MMQIFLHAGPSTGFVLAVYMDSVSQSLEDASAKRYYYISVLAMDSWIHFSCVGCLCVPKGMKMCMCNIYKKIALPSEFIRTVRLILEPAAFKKDSKAVALIREIWLCSSLWIIIIIIIPGFIYSVGL